MASHSGVSLIGPRSPARDAHLTIIQLLRPDIPDLDVTVSAVETFRPDMPIPLSGAGAIKDYRKILEVRLAPILSSKSNDATAMENGKSVYLGSWLDQVSYLEFLESVCDKAEIKMMQTLVGLRPCVIAIAGCRVKHNLIAVVTIYGSIKPANFIRIISSE